MSDKMECPSCKGYSSTVLASFRNGEPCAFCGLPHAAAVEVLSAREMFRESQLREVYEQVITRAVRAEAEVARLKSILRRVSDAVPAAADVDRRDRGARWVDDHRGDDRAGH